MSSAGKWVLGLLVLLVGAVFIARMVSNSGGPGTAATDKVQVENAAKKTGPVVAADVKCAKTCIEAVEVTNEAITTAKLAPGSVTLSKLAFDVPNLNELTTEINSRKDAEVALKAVLADASAATSKATAVVESTTASGLNNEAAARAAADSTVTSSINQEIADRSTGDKGQTDALNKEVTDRGNAITTTQTNLNDEIAKRVSANTALRFELASPIEIVGPQTLQVNHAEIVADAVQSDKILDLTIATADLAPDAVNTTKIINATIKGEDVTQVAGQGLSGLNINDGTILTNDIGNLQVTNPKLGLDAVTTDKVLNGTLKGEDVTQVLGDGLSGLNINNGTINLIDLNADSVDGSKIVDGSIATLDIGAAQVTGGVGGGLASGTITALNVFGDTLTAAELAANSVGSSELADNAVDTNAIGTGQVTSVKLASGIDGAKLGDATVDGAKLVDATVNGGKLVNATVDGGKLVDATVNGGKLVDATVNGGKLVDATVNGGKLVDATVNGGKLVDSTVASGKLAATSLSSATNLDLGCSECISDTDLKSAVAGAGGAVTGAKIDFGTVTGQANDILGPVIGNLALGTVGARNLDANAVSGHALGLPAGAITNIVKGSIVGQAGYTRTGSELGDIGLGTITGEKTPSGPGAAGNIALGTIGGGNIGKGEVTGGTDQDADPGNVGSVATGNLGVRAITAGNLAQDAVTAWGLADNSVDTNSLQDASVTTQKMTANAVPNDAGFTPTPGTLSPGTTESDAAKASLKIPDNGSPSLTPAVTAHQKHKVLVTAQVQVTCTAVCPASGEVVTWQILQDGLATNPGDGGSAVSPVYGSIISAANTIVVTPISTLITAAVTPAPHIYTLHVKFGSIAGATYTVTAASISAVDLGAIGR